MLSVKNEKEDKWAGKNREYCTVVAIVSIKRT
jgi:hypothetical protein